MCLWRRSVLSWVLIFVTFSWGSCIQWVTPLNSHPNSSLHVAQMLSPCWSFLLTLVHHLGHCQHRVGENGVDTMEDGTGEMYKIVHAWGMYEAHKVINVYFE